VVYLVLTKDGVAQTIALARATGAAVWSGADTVSTEEHLRLCSEGVKHTLFDYTLADATPEEVKDALSTIVEHHPNELVWVQHVEAR